MCKLIYTNKYLKFRPLTATLDVQGNPRLNWTSSGYLLCLDLGQWGSGAYKIGIFIIPCNLITKLLEL